MKVTNTNSTSNKKSKLCCLKKIFNNIIKGKEVVNVLNFDGIIGNVNFKQGLTLLSINKHIEKAFKGKNIKAIILNINSPGGSPVQSELIAKRIMQLSIKNNIPVIAVVEDIAASGGYWLACAASEIIVAENSILGSLGVIFSGFGFSKAIEKLGVERRVHTSGENKSLLDPFLPEKEADIKIIKNVQEEIYKNFKTHVHASRKDKLKLSDKEIFTGSIWSGKQAVDIGLADKVGDLYSEIEQRFGNEIEIQMVNQEKSWLKRKLSGVVHSIISNNPINNILASKFELQ